MVVALLRFHGDGAAALAAVKEPAIDVILETYGSGLATALHDFLTDIEEVLGHQRHVGGFKHFSVAAEHAVIEGTLEHVLVTGTGHRAIAVAGEAELVHPVAKPENRVFAARVKLKCFADKRRLHWINDDSPQLWFVEITDRRLPGPDAFAEFAPLAAENVVRKIVGVVFALAKCQIEHELALGSVLEPEGRELEGAKAAFVEHIDDMTTIEGIAGKTVGMPRQDTVRFTVLNTLEHLVEHRAALCFGASTLGEHINNTEVFLGRKFPKFGQPTHTMQTAGRKPR